MTILRAMLSLTIATVIWHAADVNMLRSFEQGNTRQGVLWVLLHVASVPFFAYSSLLFFRYQRSWWIVELPYLVMGMTVSAILFQLNLRVTLTWREAVAAVLVLFAAYLVAS